MAASFEHVGGIAFTPNFNLDLAEWAVKGVNFKNGPTKVSAFACARVVDHKRTYPYVLRLGIFDDETMVKDFVWNRPGDNVRTFALPRVIEDFSGFFRGEPQPWQTMIYSEDATSVKGIYRAVIAERVVKIGENTFQPDTILPVDQLGTPPTYVYAR